MHKDLDHGDMVNNILAYWDSASPDQIEAGARWYRQAGDIVRLIADQTGCDVPSVALTLSALSPRNPWNWNVADTYAFASAAAEGRTMPKATTFSRNREAGWRAITGQDVWLTAAPKVTAFVRAILGEEDSVVVDTWAARVATAGTVSNSKGHTVTPKEYKAIAHAYVVAANLRGVPPSTMQAVTWLVARTEGTAVVKRSRHANTFKAGTPAWLMTALLA